MNDTIIERFEKDVNEKIGVDLRDIKGLDIEKLKKDIIEFAASGGDFGCKCYYCESTPIDLVNRGDSIPIMYEMSKTICFRCTEGGFYSEVDHVKDITKKIELLKAYSHDQSFRNIQIEKLSNKIGHELL